MEILSKSGRTSIVYRYANGLVAKMPREMSAGLPGRKEWDAEVDNAFMVEKKLLLRLGLHPRIVLYACTIPTLPLFSRNYQIPWIL
jgi:hypothetical protein